MATKIGDAETAQLAAQYAEKHEKKQRVMEEKADALRKELALARAEVTEMIQGFEVCACQGMEFFSPGFDLNQAIAPTGI